MPGLIPSSQASPLLTIAVKERYDELQALKVNNFYRSYYKEVLSPERYPAIDVRRGSEKVAVDVVRGHQGKRFQITKSTQKAFEPLYYRNFFDATELQGYFRVFGSKSFNLNELDGLAAGIATERKAMTDTIERGIEIHCSTIFEDGTVTASDGTIIDFKRKAASIVDNGVGFYWDNPAHDIIGDLRAGCDFLRETGKVQGYFINVVMGADAWAAFRKNTEINTRWNQFNNKRDMLLPAQLESTGAIFQTEMDVDSYKVRVWTYNDFYEDENGDMQPYKNPKTVVMLAEKPIFSLMYGAIPQVTLDLNTSNLIVGKMVYSDFRNPEMGYHRFYAQSAPLPVPVAVDQIYTLQALAA
jgi:hypothetical protein